MEGERGGRMAIGGGEKSWFKGERGGEVDNLWGEAGGVMEAGEERRSSASER